MPGSTGTAENSSSSQQSGPPDGGPQSSITPTPHATAPKTASSASVAAKPRGRGGAAGRRGVAVATVDQTHYQPGNHLRTQFSLLLYAEF